MKRILILGTGMAVLSIAIYLGSTLSAQQTAATPATQPAPQAAPQTKIALINLNYVVKHYAKFVAFQGEMKGYLNQYQEKDKVIASQLEKKQQDLKNPAITPQAADALNTDIKNLTRQRQDNGEQGKKFLSEKSDEGMKNMYIEVYNNAKLYATARGIELVMHYNDALEQSEMWGAPNIARKLQAGACIPLWNVPSMDISPQIVQMLNQAYTQGQQPTGSAGAAPAPAAH